MVCLYNCGVIMVLCGSTFLGWLWEVFAVSFCFSLYVFGFIYCVCFNVFICCREGGLRQTWLFMEMVDSCGPLRKILEIVSVSWLFCGVYCLLAG